MIEPFHTFLHVFLKRSSAVFHKAEGCICPQLFVGRCELLIGSYATSVFCCVLFCMPVELCSNVVFKMNLLLL